MQPKHSPHRRRHASQLRNLECCSQWAPVWGHKEQNNIAKKAVFRDDGRLPVVFENQFVSRRTRGATFCLLLVSFHMEACPDPECYSLSLGVGVGCKVSPKEVALCSFFHGACPSSGPAAPFRYHTSAGASYGQGLLNFKGPG